jgi:hypothetical protein
MTSVTFAVDGPEWDSLYKNPEDKNGAHLVHEGQPIEVQLVLWPKIILRHWNKHSAANELSYLGIDLEQSPPERSLIPVRADSNLYLASGIARQIVKRSWASDPRKEHINTLFDCGLPIVISEDVKRDDPSMYVKGEGEFLVALCFLFGSIAFSGVAMRAPIIGSVTKIRPLKTIPPATILEIQLKPSQVVPESRVSYHAAQVSRVDFPTLPRD